MCDRNINLELGQAGAQTSTPIKSGHCQLTRKLFGKLIVCLKSYEIDSSEWTEQLISAAANDKVEGTIKCHLCGVTQTQFYRAAKQYGTGYWVVANFGKHLEKVHKLVKLKRVTVKPVDLKEQNDYNHGC